MLLWLAVGFARNEAAAVFRGWLQRSKELLLAIDLVRRVCLYALPAGAAAAELRIAVLLVSQGR